MGFSALSNKVLADLGDAEFPSITFLELQNYGMFADTVSPKLGFTVAGNEAFSIDSSLNFTFGGPILSSFYVQLLNGGTQVAGGIANVSNVLKISSGTVGMHLTNSTGTIAVSIDETNAFTTFSRSYCTTRTDVASAATITSLTSTTSFVKLTGVTATTIQGISVGSTGQRLTVVNLTGSNMTIAHENAGASASSRITTMTGADVSTTGNGVAEFVYDSGSARWICTYVTA